MKVFFAKTKETAIIPSKRVGDGCYDLYVCLDEDVIIKPHETKLLPTGIMSMFEPNLRIGIRERGSNTKSGLITMAGQIDSNFRNEWFLALYNSNDKDVILTNGVSEVEKGDIIKVPTSKAQAQFAIEYVPSVTILETTEESIKKHVTERGGGMLGSSGK